MSCFLFIIFQNSHSLITGTARDLYDKLADIASKKGANFEPAEEMVVANTLEFKRSVGEK